ncbi:Endonuclease YhcR precursor [Bhargavaea cecembensis DSE10]|uniref:Endonuclease YhcR n=1 Tax=Bhargavaea cecembensis DSE10 TaxID=1235279 RepID=M7P3K5_9BACL|nr:Endonuclease YhcR precursor [Bhargavaea cecembensis DSE10]
MKESGADCTLKETIHIYHTNDLHSHFERWPRIRDFLLKRKSFHKEQGEACYLFDIGDHIDRSHPYTDATRGKGNVLMLNEIGYDAVTIGNNEGITLSPGELADLYEEAKFPVVLDNLFNEEGKRPAWTVPEAYLTTRSGIRIGLIAATADFSTSYERLGWQVTGPRSALEAAAPRVSGQSDILVCLSHMGSSEDERLAQYTGGKIDVILGGHTHHLYPDGREVGGTLIAAAGKWGQYVGEVTLTFDHTEGRIVEATAEVHDTETLPIPGDDTDYDRQLRKRAAELLSSTVFLNPSELWGSWDGPTPLSDLFAEALIAHTGADCAMFNSGIFLGGLPEGPVSGMDLHRLLPHPINPCVITLTGAELEEAYELSLNPEWPDVRLKGLGFRGEQVGAMIHQEMVRGKDGKLIVAGSAVEPGRMYRLATLDLFTYGFFFPAFKQARKEYFMPELIRDVLAGYAIRKYGTPSS